MLETKQTKNGVELHYLECTNTTKINTFPYTLVLNDGIDEVGNKTAFVFTALDDDKIEQLKIALDSEEHWVEIYKISKLAYKELVNEHLERNEFTDLYTHAVDELSKLKENSEYTKALDPDE